MKLDDYNGRSGIGGTVTTFDTRRPMTGSASAKLSTNDTSNRAYNPQSKDYSQSFRYSSNSNGSNSDNQNSVFRSDERKDDGWYRSKSQKESSSSSSSPFYNNANNENVNEIAITKDSSFSDTSSASNSATTMTPTSHSSATTDYTNSLSSTSALLQYDKEENHDITDSSNLDLQSSYVEEIKDKIVDISNLLLPASSSSKLRTINDIGAIGGKQNETVTSRLYPDKSIVEDVPIINLDELLQACTISPIVSATADDGSDTKRNQRPTLLSQKSRESLRDIMIEQQQEEIRFSQRNLLQKQHQLQRTQALQAQHQQRMQQQRPSLTLSRRNLAMKDQESSDVSHTTDAPSVSSIGNTSNSNHNTSTIGTVSTTRTNDGTASNTRGLARQYQSMRIGMERTSSYRQLQQREVETATVLSNFSYHSNVSGVTGPPSATTMDRYINHIGTTTTGMKQTVSSGTFSSMVTTSTPFLPPAATRPPLVPLPFNNIAMSTSSHHNSMAGSNHYRQQQIMNDCVSIDEEDQVTDFADDNESQRNNNSPSSPQYLQQDDNGMVNHHHPSHTLRHQQQNISTNHSTFNSGGNSRYRRFDQQHLPQHNNRSLVEAGPNDRISQHLQQQRGSVNRYYQSERVIGGSSDYHRTSSPLSSNLSNNHHHRSTNGYRMYNDDQDRHHPPPQRPSTYTQQPPFRAHRPPPPPASHSNNQHHYPYQQRLHHDSHNDYYGEGSHVPRDYIPSRSGPMMQPPPSQQPNRYSQQHPYQPRFPPHEPHYPHRHPNDYHDHNHHNRHPHPSQLHHMTMPFGNNMSSHSYGSASSSGGGYRNTTATTNGVGKEMTLEISPGVHAPVRGSKETEYAVSDGFIIDTLCILCQGMVTCIADADYVLCPKCMIVSPTETKIPYQNGLSSIGLGFFM